MALKITTSSELMSNYRQAEIVSPDKTFSAIQSDNGSSLLFSIGTDGVFYLTEEVISGGTGWQKHDLSSGLVDDFPEGSTIIAKTFAIDQDINSGKYAVVLAATVEDNDYLYFCDQYTRDENGAITLNWQSMPFDAEDKQNTVLNISDLYILHTAAAPLIVVNIISDNSATIERYYIDSKKEISDYYWNLYTLPLNMSPDNVSMCGGRKINEYVDGIYALGKVGTVSSLYYQQIYSPYDPTIAGSTGTLNTGNAEPEAMASSPSAVADHSLYTDLYVSTAAGDLYLFTADNQQNGAQGLKIMNHELLQSVLSLYAFTVDNKAVIWGLNRSQQVFYTESDISQIKDPSAWSYPVPIVSNVEQISPYKNRSNGGNTFFLHTGTNELKKASQDPQSTSWTYQDILLPVDPDSQSQKCNCYMTRFTVCDNNNAALANVSLQLSSAYRIPVYINNRYYILDQAPISVTTDSVGAIKVVQRVDNLQGARLKMQSEDNQTVVTVNPMNNAVAKIATLNSADALSNAYITDDNGNREKPLVDPDIASEDLDNAAASINAIIDAYNNYNLDTFAAPKMASPAMPLQNLAFSPGAKVHTLVVRRSMLQGSAIEDVGDTLSDIGDAIVVAAGDLCSWLHDVTEYIIQIVEDTAQKVWHFVAKVGEAVYTFVINTIEKAVAALVAIFDLLKTIVTDLIQFVKFLFSWDDIKRTNELYVNMITLYLNYGISKVSGVKGKINEEIADMMDDINEWADLPSVSDGEYANQPLTYQQSQTDNSDLYTTPNTYLQDHFTNNISHAQFTALPQRAISELIKDLLVELIDALKKEGQVLKEVAAVLYDQLFKDDQYKTMSLTEVIKIIVALLTDTLLATAATVLDAFIDLIVELFNDIMDLLTQPVWIPVVSDILKVIDYEFEFSLLDVVCMIGAIPATLLYKLTKKEAPFTEDDGFSTQIIQAQSLEDLEKLFGRSGEIDYSKEFYSLFDMPQPVKDTLFITSHYVSCVAAISKAPLIIAEDLAELPYVPIISRAKQICSVVGSLSYTVAGTFARPYPIENESVHNLSSALAFCSFSQGAFFFAAPYMIGSEVTKSVVAELGAVIDMVVSLTSIAPVAYHFAELSDITPNNFRTLAILDETVRLTNYLSSIANDFAKFDPEPLTSTAIAITSSLLALSNGGLQFSECCVDD